VRTTLYLRIDARRVTKLTKWVAPFTLVGMTVYDMIRSLNEIAERGGLNKRVAVAGVLRNRPVIRIEEDDAGDVVVLSAAGAVPVEMAPGMA
jgi:hypothetical protein